MRQLLEINPQCDAAFIAVIGEAAGQRIIGVCRYNGDVEQRSCECAVAVSDAWQNQGLGTLMMRHLIRVARERGFDCMFSLDAVENAPVQALAQRLGFRRRPHPADGRLLLHWLDLR
jgi:RimJ/RimL family protein N-acetyltransferase